MKFLSKIKAFFRFRDQDAEMEVSSAEIKNGKVFLHPLKDKDHIVCVKAEAVDIIISPNENLQEDDVKIIEVKKSDKEEAQPIILDRKQPKKLQRQKNQANLPETDMYSPSPR